MTAYRAAFSLLPELLWIGHSIPVRHNAIHRLNISGATSTAIRTCINHFPLSSIVEILEQGLATTFQQMLQLKTAVDRLPAEQAQIFQQLSMKLYSGASEDHMSLVNQRNELIQNIRKQPSFEFFLLPLPYNVLCHAAQGGPVVILSSHRESCDGIIIVNPISEPVHIALPNVTLDLLYSHRTILKKVCGRKIRGESVSTRLFGYQEGSLSSQESFEDMLLWLWSSVVSPIYQALASVSENVLHPPSLINLFI